MRVMKKILVPCDFSACALEAYQFAIKIAAKTKGEVHVMKAIDLPVMMVAGFDVQPYVYDPNLLKELEGDARLKFDKLKERYGSEGVPVSFHVMYEPPTPAIRQFVKANGIDLVILGTKGTSGLNEYLLGSNTEKVVRSSPVPVIAVRRAADLFTIKKIVFPSTLPLDQSDWMKKLKELQAFFGASLEVLWINTPMNFKTDTESKALLEEFSKFYKLDNVHLHVRNDTIEEDAITHFTKEIKGDMIAMATHGRRGLAHALMGSVAEDVVNHIQCPIWTYSMH
jgi:nucleotide-binding universal stress UspA family protein